MIVLDTNVISELMTPRPDGAVLTWLSAQPPASIFTTATTQAEILFGIRILPAGRRRSDLEVQARAIFLEDMAGQVLPFDTAAGDFYATIAAIALSCGASVATRNTADFTDIDLHVINPWNFRG
jgi:predicted nucleic acid-binding protein